MGVVYLARHERLKRTVALKMIQLGSQTHPERLARFRREMELIARVKHGNVVQIYEAGEHEGRPFLAMEYVEGGTLSQKLVAGPLPIRSVAEVTEAIARGMHAAHECGVVHRDLKPANVLLGLDGSPRITDFGLARALVSEFEDSSFQWDTQSGTILGTPSYAAPEQVSDSREAGPAADTYALGAILYECLTGRPPFKAATPLETLEQVRTREPVSPRSLQPSVPRDLETICLRCLRKDPRRRYPSAAALADDLRRFLDGKPVLARPTPVWERLWMWARRRPALASLVVVSTLALAGLLMGGVVYERRLSTALDRAESQRERADANYHQAREAMSKMLASASARNRADLPRLQELLREQQEAALAFFLAVAEQADRQDPEVRYDIAQARLEAGILQQSLGRREIGRDNLERAAGLLEELAAAFPAERRYRSSQAHALNALGNWHGFTEQAHEYHTRALTLLEKLVQDDEATVEDRVSLAVSHHCLGTVAWEQKQWEEAARHSRQAVALRLEVLRERPGDPEILLGLAQTYLLLSNTYQQQKERYAEAQEFHDRADATLEQLIGQDAYDFRSLTSLAALRVNWAYVLAGQGQTEKALADLGKNVALLEKARQQEPDHALVRDMLYRTHGVRAQLLEGAKRYREEVIDRKRVVEVLEPGIEKEYQRLFLAMAYARSGDHANAFAEAEALGAAPPHPASEYQQFDHLARVCAIALTALGEDSSLATRDRDAQKERYAAKAVELLAKAREAAGPAEWKRLVPGLLMDRTFQPLRGRPDFQRLLKN
jgi:serine/threonine-protein kinase